MITLTKSDYIAIFPPIFRFDFRQGVVAVISVKFQILSIVRLQLAKFSLIFRGTPPHYCTPHTWRKFDTHL